MDFDSREAKYSLTGAPDISFVVPSFQSDSTIEMTLRSIRGQQSSLSCEIVVVHSSPGSLPAALETGYPGLQVVRSPHRLWPGAARNLGANHASGRWLAFVDADAILERDWLEYLHAKLQIDLDTMAGGRVANANPEADAGSVLHWLEFSEFLPGQRGGVMFCPETGIRHRHRGEWDQVVEHLNRHGHWSGIYRRLHPAPGSFLARIMQEP